MNIRSAGALFCSLVALAAGPSRAAAGSQTCPPASVGAERLAEETHLFTRAEELDAIRYAGGWYSGGRRSLKAHVAFADARPADKVAIAGIVCGDDKLVQVDSVRYPQWQLDGWSRLLSEDMDAHPLDGPNDPQAIGVGVDAELNKVSLEMTSPSADLVARARALMPPDALRVSVTGGCISLISRQSSSCPRTTSGDDHWLGATAGAIVLILYTATRRRRRKPAAIGR